MERARPQENILNAKSKTVSTAAPKTPQTRPERTYPLLMSGQLPPIRSDPGSSIFISRLPVPSPVFKRTTSQPSSWAGRAPLTPAQASRGIEHHQQSMLVRQLSRLQKENESLNARNLVLSDRLKKAEARCEDLQREAAEREREACATELEHFGVLAENHRVLDQSQRRAASAEHSSRVASERASAAERAAREAEASLHS
eukprot:6341582-Prymnesium_polylepis.1